MRLARYLVGRELVHEGLQETVDILEIVMANVSSDIASPLQLVARSCQERILPREAAC